MPRATATPKDSAANLGFEGKLWLAADKFRSNMDAAVYKHVALGLIFLKYISDQFEEHRSKMVEGKRAYARCAFSGGWEFAKPLPNAA